MITVDTNQPSFSLYPINNNRTAWRNFGLPIILVVPHITDSTGIPLANSSVSNVRIYIENVPQEALVAGYQHIGLKFPDRELYSVSVANLANYQFNPEQFLQNGVLNYTTTTGLISQLQYVPNSAYYDLSDINLDVELLPPDVYNLVYSANYYARTTSSDGLNEFLCIDTTIAATAVYKFKINHPGDIIREFTKLTPVPYLSDASKAKDTTIGLYRPFTDILNDILDEQNLIPQINWVFKAPPATIPYLSAILGWELPYFPSSLDSLRKAVLRRTVEFQRQKGSRRVINNIFQLFGFEILINNLWWSTDGQTYIRPNQILPAQYQNQQIITQPVNQVETLLSAYSVTDFTTLAIPLLFRPQELAGLDLYTALKDGGNLTVVSYTVTPGGQADTTLATIASEIYSNPSGYGSTANCVTDINGFIFPQVFDTALAGQEILGFSQIDISGNLAQTVTETITGKIVPVISTGLKFNRETNTLTLTINGNQEFIGLHIYSFAIYQRYETVVPPALANLQSSMFDIQVITQNTQEYANPVVLEFALEFLKKSKAFHSQLNTINTVIDVTETYEATDLEIGGDVTQRYNTDIGRLQVPPAIIPNIPTESQCLSFDPTTLGYKPADLLLRYRKLANLIEELAAWQILDNRVALVGNTRINPNIPIIGRTSNLYTSYGQDRIIKTRANNTSVVYSPTPNSNSGGSGGINNQLSPNNTILNGVGPTVSTNGNSGNYGQFMKESYSPGINLPTTNGTTDYYYAGRVEDSVLYRPLVPQTEPKLVNKTALNLGSGVYWSYPTQSKVVYTGTANPGVKSSTQKTILTGNSITIGSNFYTNGNPVFTQTSALSPDQNSMLGRLCRNYGVPTDSTIHFTNRNSINFDQRYQLALQRPSLNIYKPTMHFPGCRFATMNSLQTTFTSSVYNLRPWDIQPCDQQMSYSIVNNSLVFVTVPYTIKGNGLTPDITNLADTGSTIFTVVHSVYMNNSGGSPAITLDGVCNFDSTVSSAGLINTIKELFTTANGGVDFADGYGGVTGLQTYTQVYNNNEVILGLVNSTPVEVLFYLGSGILTSEKGYRLDGGMTLANGSPTLTNSLSAYLDDLVYNFDPDHVCTSRNLVGVEIINPIVFKLDGSITSMLEM